MKVKAIIKMSLFVAILSILFLTWYFRPRYVKLELITSVQNTNINVNDEKSDFRAELHWWFIDSYPNSEDLPRLGTVAPDLNSYLISSNPDNLKNWGINFDELGVDFSKNNVILAFSREIKEMKFKRADYFPYQSISTVKTIMSIDFEPNKIYIYKIPKYEVCEDFRAYTETILKEN